MPNYIDREKTREIVCDFCRWAGTSNCEECEHPVDDVPIADVVDVVRCKECIHDNSNDPICPIPWVKRMLDSYCSFGERKADNG